MSFDDSQEVADDLVTEDGADTSIDGRRLASLLGGGLVVALASGGIRLFNAVLEANVRAIDALTGFLTEFVTVALGDSAALQVEAWRTAFLASAETGAIAPFILAVEVIVLVAFATAVWERRPYA
ncbi:hypothetical protein [Haloprofundus sp. MHR1]|uniref:hypothetical protein n=1 Tax=Haloprofundus sp. MHR1 TaxID=2572921 RepID=UPI0010BEF157|nr:hypothetical protein [Haloprofundus sp. MHR1]QCJ47245.1 hypothetical protein FCF25_09005 [Haloprofundus sp. MHR1]